MAIKVIYHLDHLTGGIDSTYLDYIDGNSLSNKDVAFVEESDVFYVYKLDSTSGAAESSPDIISPDTNAGTKRWMLQGTAWVYGWNREVYKTQTADSPLTAIQCAGTIVSNYGMTNFDCDIDLPTAAEGLAFFCVLPTVRAKYFRLHCPAAQSDKINLLTVSGWVAGADDGYIGVASGYAAYDMISMVSLKVTDGGFEWFASPIVGTWVAG